MGYGVDDEQAQGCDAEGLAHRGGDRKKKTRILNELVGLTGWYHCDALKLCEMKPYKPRQRTHEERRWLVLLNTTA